MGINYKQIAYCIRQERTRTGISQEKLAEMTDSSPQYISHIETGRKKPSLEMIIRIANALDVSVDQLLSENLTGRKYKCDEELAHLINGCSNYERKVILDLALAARYILKENHRLLLIKNTVN